MCFIQESKLELVIVNIIRKVWSNDNFDFRFLATDWSFGGVITTWDKGNFQVGNYHISKKFIVEEGKWIIEDLKATLVNVVNAYALNMVSDKISLLMDIIDLKNSFVSPWIIDVDFNAIRNMIERSKYVGLVNGSREFNNFINDYKLVNLLLTGKKFTWFGPNNKRNILDRFLLEEMASLFQGHYSAML